MSVCSCVFVGSIKYINYSDSISKNGLNNNYSVLFGYNSARRNIHNFWNDGGGHRRQNRICPLYRPDHLGLVVRMGKSKSRRRQLKPRKLLTASLHFEGHMANSCRQRLHVHSRRFVQLQQRWVVRLVNSCGYTQISHVPSISHPV